MLGQPATAWLSIFEEHEGKWSQNVWETLLSNLNSVEKWEEQLVSFQSERPQKPTWRIILCSFTFMRRIAPSRGACMHSTTPTLQHRFRTLGLAQPSHECFKTPARHERLTVGSVDGSTGEWWGAAGETGRERETRKRHDDNRVELGKVAVWRRRWHIYTENKFLQPGASRLADTPLVFIRPSCTFLKNQFVLIFTVPVMVECLRELIDRLIVINMLMYEWWEGSMQKNTPTQFSWRWNIYLVSLITLDFVLFLIIGFVDIYSD